MTCSPEGTRAGAEADDQEGPDIHLSERRLRQLDECIERLKRTDVPADEAVRILREAAEGSAEVLLDFCAADEEIKSEEDDLGTRPARFRYRHSSAGRRRRPSS